MKKSTAFLFSGLLVFTSCAPVNKNNTYTAADAGRNNIVSFGKIVSAREVEVQANPSGVGAVAGGTAGGFAGSAIGNGSGNTTAIVAGALIGLIGGAIAEHELGKGQGIEYVVYYSALSEAKSIVQVAEKGEKMLPVGSCVMVQQKGDYQRVLPAPDPKLCALDDDSTTRRTKSMTKHKKNKKVENENDE